MVCYNPFSLAGKTILVTGASSGIGRSVAIECSKMGATLVITGRNKERLNETFEAMQGASNQQLTADLSDAAQFEAFISCLPLLDGVVHCAGLTKTLPFGFLNAEALHEVMSVNFTAPTLISAQLVKAKKINKMGSVVFISSISGKYCTLPGNSIYTASKSALDGIAKGMALELAAKRIRVNSVHPAMVETAIMDAGIVSKEQMAEDAVKNYPLKRYGKPEEVAYAVIYLLSDAANWVTGSNLVIDGGYTLQ